MNKTTIALAALLTLAACDSTDANDMAEKTLKSKSAAEAVAEKAEPKKVTEKAEQQAAPKALSEAEVVKGQHFIELDMPFETTAASHQVEVIELLWLKCGHCYNLEHTIDTYRKNKPSYVAFQQVPAMLNPQWSKDGELFYLVSMLDSDGSKNLIKKTFAAIHEQGRNLSNPRAAASFIKSMGYSEEDIKTVTQSLEYKSKLAFAKKVSLESQISSVPSIVVDGRYVTSVYKAGTHDNLLTVVNYLTKKAKSAK